MTVDKNINILIVDDYEVMLQAVSTLLEILGFTNVTDAFNGEEALSKMQSNTFDLVISDWNMEPMSGTVLLDNIRKDPVLSHIPVIMISAEKRPEIVNASKKAGASNYLIKPFKAETLLKKIESVMS